MMEANERPMIRKFPAFFGPERRVVGISCRELRIHVPKSLANDLQCTRVVQLTLRRSGALAPRGALK
jgi:hypothetical protein